MSILIGKDTRIIVQGITGRDGSFHALSMREYGSQVVGGVTPGKGGQEVEGIPVFDTVAQAVEKTGADCTVIFVPARFASAALHEAADARIPLVVCITEGIPVLEMIENTHYLAARGCRLIGPNCPGLITPGESKAGIMPGPHPPAGGRRRDLAQRDAYLRGCLGAYARGPGTVHLHRSGGGPGDRHGLCRAPETFRRRPGHGGSGPDRRDRRRGRGESRGIHSPQHAQAGRGVHFRAALRRRRSAWVMPVQSFPAAEEPRTRKSRRCGR